LIFISQKKEMMLSTKVKSKYVLEMHKINSSHPFLELFLGRPFFASTS